ncbi:unnamed protein product [Echinostoma caproni]|uniref:Ion_trans domain-containing protein n=1 Tax=Echinostoma caproni TaxID=27848 RepID=A0A183BF95_9TREM|nr:unnamed protein product [Echinostoma caproni]
MKLSPCLICKSEVCVMESFYSLLVKSLITASTFILVTLIVFYHAVDIKLFSVNNCIEDWRIATSPRKMGFVVLEVLLCMIHPPPILSNYMWPSDQLHSDSSYDHSSHPDVTFPPPRYTTAVPGEHHSISSKLHIPDTENSSASYATVFTTPYITSTPRFVEHKSEFISLELSLSIPMFLRLYLIFRVLLLHSTFFTDAGSRSIGALNRVKINVRFVLKTLATAQPGTMLLIFILFMWVITSWIMRVCERLVYPIESYGLVC